MTDLTFSTDHHREQELARLGIDAEVRTSFGGNRRAVVELTTDGLDRLVCADDEHDECIHVDQHEDEIREAEDEAREEGRGEGYDDGHEDGFDDGYAKALADIAALAEGSA
jgi:flagellar biosynthesis/type III secretory pathway protein FliH